MLSVIIIFVAAALSIGAGSMLFVTGRKSHQHPKTISSEHPKGLNASCETELIRMIKQLSAPDSIHAVISLILHGADVNARDIHGIPTVILLLKSNIHINAKIKILELMNKAGCDFNAMDTAGNTALFFAKNADLMDCLLKNGTIPNAQNVQGKTALHQVDSVSAVEVLVKHGAHPNIRDKYGKTPLFYINRMDCAIRLIELGADPCLEDNAGSKSIWVNARGSFKQEYCGKLNENLGKAVEADDTNAVKFFLANGANPNYSTEYHTVLTLACHNRNPQIIELLCKAGANVNIEDQFGISPMDEAKNSPKCTQILKKYGARG